MRWPQIAPLLEFGGAQKELCSSGLVWASQKDARLGYALSCRTGRRRGHKQPVEELSSTSRELKVRKHT